MCRRLSPRTLSLPASLPVSLCRLALAVAFVLQASSLKAQDLAAAGPEFQINSTTAGGQYSARVASAPGRGFVVVWASLDNGADQDVRGRLFAPDGAPVGEDFRVHEITAGNQGGADVAMGDDGGFVVVWSSDGGEPGTDGFDIQARRFDASASPVGGQFLVNAYTTGLQSLPAVAVANGGFVVAWTSVGSPADDDSGSSVQARRLASDGSLVGSQLQVNADTTGHQNRPAVAPDDAGGFLVTWLSQPTFNPGQTGVQSRRFGSDGVALGTEIQVSETLASVQSLRLATGEGGAFTATWNQFDLNTFISSVFFRSFDALDAPLGAAHPVSADAEISHSLPSVTYGAEDDLLVAWTAGPEAGLSQTRARRFTTSGEAVGAEFVANTFSNEYQYAPDVTMDDAGSFVVVWESGSSPLDDSGYSIRARRFGVERVTGLAWNDLDGDGRQDGSEPRMAGVEVGILDLDGTVRSTTVTDAAGVYRLPGPPPGPHYVQVEAPAGYVFTAQDQGPSDDLDSDVDSQNGDTQAFDFDLGLDFEWDAGLRSDTGTIGDRVWIDDGNGIQDGGEIGLVGVVVNLYNPAGSLQATTVTDLAGLYAFEVASGDYYLEFVPPEGNTFAPRDQGTDDGADSDVNAASGTTSVFTLTAGGVETGHDAGLILLPLFADGFESGDLSAWSSSEP